MKVVQLVQNAGLSATLLWRFVIEYSRAGRSPSLPILFFVLPILLHSPTARHITSTQKRTGLRGFVSKLGKNSSELLAIHSRMMDMRSHTLHALAVAESASLLSISPKDASVSLLCFDDLHWKKELTTLEINSLKLGYWFSDHSLSELSLILRVYI